MAILRLQLVPQNNLTQLILTEVAARLNRSLLASLISIRLRISEELENAVERSPEYRALQGGRLQGEMGVVDVAPVARAIVKNISAGIQLEHRPIIIYGKGLTGGLTLRVMRTDLSDVLGIADGVFTSEGGYTIPWLSWLLSKGDTLLVADFAFLPGTFATSRTGIGIMRKRGGWRVPPEFAGTEQSNWLSRALDTMADEVANIIFQEVQRHL